MIMMMIMMNLERYAEIKLKIERKIKRERLGHRLREYREANYSDGEFFGAAN